MEYPRPPFADGLGLELSLTRAKPITSQSFLATAICLFEAKPQKSIFIFTIGFFFYHYCLSQYLIKVYKSRNYSVVEVEGSEAIEDLCNPVPTKMARHEKSQY